MQMEVGSKGRASGKGEQSITVPMYAHAIVSPIACSTKIFNFKKEQYDSVHDKSSGMPQGQKTFQVPSKYSKSKDTGTIFNFFSPGKP